MFLNNIIYQIVKIFNLKQESNHYWFKKISNIIRDKFNQKFEQSKQNFIKLLKTLRKVRENFENIWVNFKIILKKFKILDKNLENFL